MTSQLPGFFEGTGMPEPGWWEALWPDPAKVLRDVGVAPGMDVVDLCSGDGWFTSPLSRIARSVIAIDIDAALLEARKVCEGSGRFALRFATRTASIPAIPYPSSPSSSASSGTVSPCRPVCHCAAAEYHRCLLWT